MWSFKLLGIMNISSGTRRTVKEVNDPKPYPRNIFEALVNTLEFPFFPVTICGECTCSDSDTWPEYESRLGQFTRPAGLHRNQQILFNNIQWLALRYSSIVWHWRFWFQPDVLCSLYVGSSESFRDVVHDKNVQNFKNVFVWKPIFFLTIVGFGMIFYDIWANLPLLFRSTRFYVLQPSFYISAWNSSHFGTSESPRFHNDISRFKAVFVTGFPSTWVGEEREVPSVNFHFILPFSFGWRHRLADFVFKFSVKMGEVNIITFEAECMVSKTFIFIVLRAVRLTKVIYIGRVFLLCHWKSPCRLSRQS